MVVLSIRYNLLRGHSSEWNREVKHVGGGVVWWWVTDREVWARLKFDQKLSVIIVKNILIERLRVKQFKDSKKIKKNSNFFWKNYKLCRRGYADGRSYADDQIELCRGAFYVEDSPRRRLRRRQFSLCRELLAVGVLKNSYSEYGIDVLVNYFKNLNRWKGLDFILHTSRGTRFARRRPA
jgi:hypothetical protein